MNRRGVAIGVAAALVAATGIGVGVAVAAGGSSHQSYGGMIGGATPPGWMMGGSIANSMMGGSMMGTGHDPGQVMGRRLADVPGARVSPNQAAQLDDRVPAYATGTLTFTASAAGTYQYLCPVPGHAQKGMAGSLVINSGHG